MDGRKRQSNDQDANLDFCSGSEITTFAGGQAVRQLHSVQLTGILQPIRQYR